MFLRLQCLTLGIILLSPTWGDVRLPLPQSDENQNVYDFIVVGGGTAGCVVASRLSENGRYTVLLVEIGGYPHFHLDIPGLVSNLYSNRDVLRRYKTVPQENANQENGGIIDYLVGQALGGSSQLNGMYFNRGSPLDYDNWARLTGDQSWNYANMLKYFKRVEDYHGDFPLTSQHGSGGPITITRPSYAPGLKEWLDAGRSLGYPVADPNGPQQVSFTPIEFSKRFGRRVSSFTGYIKHVMVTRKKLNVVPNANVRRILFEDNPISGNIRASGIMYTTNTTSTFAHARKEIIVSAGAIGSPTILLRSGLGPRRALQNAGIRMVKNLPIGENLHDHVGVLLPDLFINSSSVVMDPERDHNPEAWRLYNRMGDGPYSSQFGQHGQAFLTSSQSIDHTWPDLHLLQFMTPGLPGNNSEGKNGMHPGETQVISFPMLVRPKSRGRITLNATDIDADPLVDFKYLDSYSDRIALVDGIKAALEIFETTPSFQRLGARYSPNPLPACRHLQFRSDEYWQCFIKQKTVTGLHAAGSCRMGRGAEAVVDTTLKVIGMDGLRVVDASIMPEVVNANTQAAVYGIAEKASEMILQDWSTMKS